VAKKDPVAALEKRVNELTQRVGILEDTQEIRNLQHAYGYYMDNFMYDAVIDLFADDIEIHFFGGVYKGKAGARRLYIDRLRKNFAAGTDGPKYGKLLEHTQFQDIVHVAPDRLSAKARFRYFLQGGTHYSAGEATQWWEGGVYENIYVKRDGKWQVKVMVPKVVYIGTFEHGWAHVKPQFVPFASKTYPADPMGPDELAKVKPALWPEKDLLPFHYRHPVTGKLVNAPAGPGRKPKAKRGK
jgi:hypothetical protein